MKRPSILAIPWLLLVTAVVASQSPVSGVSGRFFRGDGLGEMFSLEIKAARFSYVLGTDVGTREKIEGAVEMVDLWTIRCGNDRLGPWHSTVPDNPE